MHATSVPTVSIVTKANVSRLENNFLISCNLNTENSSSDIILILHKSSIVQVEELISPNEPIADAIHRWFNPGQQKSILRLKFMLLYYGRDLIAKIRKTVSEC